MGVICSQIDGPPAAEAPLSILRCGFRKLNFMQVRLKVFSEMRNTDYINWDVYTKSGNRSSSEVRRKIIRCLGSVKTNIASLV